MTRETTRKPVVIVGGGPAGLRAATELAAHVPVLLLEREQEPGGIPRHCHHSGFGIRDLHRSLGGSEYARRLAAAAYSAGVDIRTSTMATGWCDERTLEVTSPSGRELLSADAIILATGARERARAARWIPGDRPAGIFTTGQLQQAVHLHGQSIGGRAVIVGAESVSWSAVLTLREAGCETVALISKHTRPESYALFALAGKYGLRVPVRTDTRVTRVLGHGRVAGVEVELRTTGHREVIHCDTVVFSADWIPDNELARAAGLELSAGSRGPVVDAALRTSRAGVFAIGNLVHPVDTADIAALDGAHAATAVLAHLGGSAQSASVGIEVDPPLRWIAPAAYRIDAGKPSRNHLLSWSDAYIRAPRISVFQAGVQRAARRVPWPAAPGRIFRIPAAILDNVNLADGTIHIRVE